MTLKRNLTCFALMLFCMGINAAEPSGKDTSGNPLTDATLMGDIDGRDSNVAGMIQVVEKYGPFATTNDVTLTPVSNWSEWTVVPDPLEQPDVALYVIDYVSGSGQPWVLTIKNAAQEVIEEFNADGPENAVSLDFFNIAGETLYRATRIQQPSGGFFIGTQTNKVLASYDSVSNISTNYLPATRIAETAYTIDAELAFMGYSKFLAGLEAGTCLRLINGATWDSIILDKNGSSQETLPEYLESLYLPTTNLTKTAYAGYDAPFSEWQNDWNPSDALYFPMNPEWTGAKWVFNFTNSLGKTFNFGGDQTYHLSTNALVNVNGTDCRYWRTATPYYTNLYGLATLQNLAAYAKKTDLEDYVTKQGLDSYDASYDMSSKITDENQTVTFLNYLEVPYPTNITIQIPKNGRCKDWIVYVVSQTNVAITLTGGVGYDVIWWVPEMSVTNDIPGSKPVALYFSQVANYDTYSIFTMGRREFETLPTLNAVSARFLKKFEALANKKREQRVIRRGR